MQSDFFWGMTISVTKRGKTSENRIIKCSESNRQGCGKRLSPRAGEQPKCGYDGAYQF